MRVLVALLSSLFATVSVYADSHNLAESDPNKAGLVHTLTMIADRLPEDKHDRALKLIDDFADGRISSDYTYGWRRAQPFLQSGGVDALIAEARRPVGTLRYATTDALLAAGANYLETAPHDSERLNATLLDLARNADDFERQIYAHASAELAAIRCDETKLDHALSLVKHPDSLNYKFWKARLANATASVISAIDIERLRNDTRILHQAIDGYRIVDDFGPCQLKDAPIAD
ncbi:MAG: hypothetical protein AAGH90_11685 [Pseudomonadota bacterium]